MRHIKVIIVLACFAGFMVFAGCSSKPLPPLKSAEPKTPLSQFVPSNLGIGPAGGEASADMDLKTAGAQYVGFPERVDKEIGAVTTADDSMRVRYFECAEGAKAADVKRTEPAIVTYVVFNKNVLEAVQRKAIRIPDDVYPFTGLTLERGGSATLATPGFADGETTLTKSLFFDGEGNRILVYYLMCRNGDIVPREKISALKNWQRLPESERTGYLAQVEFSMVIGKGWAYAGGMPQEQIQKAEDSMDKFVPLFLAKLARFLPAPVK